MANVGRLGQTIQLTPNDVAKLQPGRVHYSGLLTERGTYVDDLLVYPLASDDFMLVVNAANSAKDLAWIEEHHGEGVEIEDLSDEYALLALQGPKAEEILADLTEVDLASMRYYRFEIGEVAGHRALISRTGYTGEDGFELYLAPADAPAVWDRLLTRGGDQGLLPAGLLNLTLYQLYGTAAALDWLSGNIYVGWSLRFPKPLRSRILLI